MSNKKKVLIALGLFALIILAIALKPRWDRFWAVDACVDRGGRFNYETGECETIETCVEKGGRFNDETGECEFTAR